ncbi:MAG: glycosyltransferase family 2 protein [Planctomycetota bacterium]|nr:MAG: glycosyltransferase family 2 protein [Planctomycetota bacterium]REK45871.1 MAG: glycosyltransferase family 2 protein [Planctomycetota bacterium]
MHLEPGRAVGRDARFARPARDSRGSPLAGLGGRQQFDRPHRGGDCRPRTASAVRRIFVPQQGKSHALNALVERLDGDLVLWTDDDVRVDRRWLATYVAAARQHREMSFFGGPIVPRFLAPEPSWLRPAWKEVAGVFGERDLGELPLEFDRKELPYGAAAIHRSPAKKPK